MLRTQPGGLPDVDDANASHHQTALTPERRCRSGVGRRSWVGADWPVGRSPVVDCSCTQVPCARPFWQDGKYDLDFKNPDSKPADYKTGAEMAAYYKAWFDKYPFVSIEDVLSVSPSPAM
eukprot:15470481-Alexandrium_andersonii.AAC.2